MNWKGQGSGAVRSGTLLRMIPDIRRKEKKNSSLYDEVEKWTFEEFLFTNTGFM